MKSGSRLEVPRGVIGENPAARDDDGAVAYGVDLFQQMGRDDDGLACGHLVDELTHLVFLVGVQPVGRLIENEHLGIVEDGLRQPHPATIAFRERVDGLFQDRFQVQQTEDLVQPRPAVGSRQFTRVGDEFQERPGVHFRVTGRTLGQVADPALGRGGLGFDVKAADPGAAGRGGQKTGDDPHRRRLARAVGPEETQYLARTHLKA